MNSPRILKNDKGSMKKARNAQVWDVVVIGGGPSGMMSAGRAAECGAKVLLLEKNDSLGKKLLITGGGRCNVTNAELDNRELLKKFKDNAKFLFSPFSTWSVKETLDFFHLHKMQTKIENEKRVFPTSDSARSVLNVLVEYLKEGDVTVRSNSEVKNLLQKKTLKETDTNKTKSPTANEIECIELKDGTKLHAKSFILATGGTSRPETGSTGDGFKWLSSLGHTVKEPTVALVPIALSESWLRATQGVTIPEVNISVLQNGQRQATEIESSANTQAGVKNKKTKAKLVHKGKILFTHFGISGPTILNMSRDIGEMAKYGDTYISLDIIPKMDHGTLNKSLNDLFRKESNKKLKNCLSLIDSSIPTSIFSVVIEKSGVNPDTPAHSVTREDRLRIVDTIKNFNIKVKGLLGSDKAIVSSGGVILEEVDFKYMRSRLFDNLYLVGDILNIDRPSGGFSLQLCWTTGYVAGTSSAEII